MFRIVNCSLIALLALAAAARAQLPAKQAEKQLKADVKQTLATWKGSVDTAVDGFYAAQAAFDSVGKSGGYSDDGLADLFTKYNEACGTILVATLDNATKAEVQASQLLDDVAGPGGSLMGLLPDGFQTGAGGALDGLRDGMEKTLGATCRAIDKHLAKTAKLLASGSAVRLNVRIAPPCSGHDAAVNQKKVASMTSWPGLTIDAVLAASRDGVTGDGTILIGGSADPAKGNVTVTVKTGNAVPGGAEVVSTFTVASGDIEDYRWGLWLVDASEGNWVISATQGSGSPVVTSSIGVP